MTAPDRPRGHLPTGAVRELLEVIRDFLDLPFVADWDEEPKRDAELQGRVGRLVALLEVTLMDGTLEEIAEAIRAELAQELPFTPESSDLTAERHAMLAARLAERPRRRWRWRWRRGPRRGGPGGTIGV